ncbi:carboxy terminal-processing peptidase [Bacteroidota bacterium]
MRKFLTGLFLLIFVVSCEAQTPQQLAMENQSIDTNKVLVPAFNHPKIDQVIEKIFQRAHYKKFELNDSLSSVIFDNYLNIMDRSKLYFVKSDVDRFEIYRSDFDDDINNGTLDPSFDIFNVFKNRVNERIDYVLNRLPEGFDFAVDEYFEPDREEADWAETQEELDELWRKRLKNDALNLVLSGKDWDGVVETLSNRYKRYHKLILQYKSEDVFQLFMNAFSETIDPHTNYMSPITSDNFRISMSLSFEGIGAQLTMRDEYTTIQKVLPGGPVFKGGILKEGDRIVGVAQGSEGEMIDVIGWRLDDVVQLIRGEKGTEVKLQVLKADAEPGLPPEEIVIVRDEVKLEEQAAKKEIITINENDINFKLGVITIPSFYIDFDAKSKGEEEYKSTTRDVRRLLNELNEEGVDGVIIDLRNNGGGALQEAIDLTGLFVEKGPVVQVRHSNNLIEVGRDYDPNIVYTGPLAVMVNRFSASASEIFTGAIQDYGRGIVIGEQTYGKGTVQNLLDLNRFMPTVRDKLGQLKLTIAKYYRITGGTTQHLGVVPDILYPAAVPHEEFGESSKPSALPWDKIEPVKFDIYDDLSDIIPVLQEEHAERIAQNQEFQFLMEDYAAMRERRSKKSFSLNEEQRKLEREESEAQRKAREESRQNLAGIELEGQEEVALNNLNIDDPLLEEGGHILANLILFSKDK